jgi:hypothetical protein
MARFQLRAAALAVILSAWTLQTVRAQELNQVAPQTAPAPFLENGGAASITNSHGQVAAQPANFQEGAPAIIGTGIPEVTTQGTPAYPYLNAPLYSSPRQNIPYQVGGAVITNQALYPQEMLYAHKYRAMYPPYYYQVRGHWHVTPFGMRQMEGWKLRGTEVKVNYKSHISPFSGFCPPATW